jgi:hypothetical protein
LRRVFIVLLLVVALVGAASLDRQPTSAAVAVNLEAGVMLGGGGGLFSSGTGPLFRGYFIQGSDAANGAIYGQTNSCGQAWDPIPPLPLTAPGTYDFSFIGDGAVAPDNSMTLYFTGFAPITVSNIAPDSVPVTSGTVTITVTNFYATFSPYIDRVGTCSVGADGYQDSIGHFTVNLTAAPPPPPPLPTSIDECKDGGWRSFDVFKNQGDCVSFVSTGGRNTPAQ